jgi:lipopolysaccharide transport system ATP-binding protein
MPPGNHPSAHKSPLISRLPGLLSQTRHTFGRVWRRIVRPTLPHTVFHITHYKAGSQWIRQILHELAPAWLITPRHDGSQFLHDPIRPRHIYPTIYVSREQFESVAVPADSRRFVVIRDLRDTLISAYFSLKISHTPLTEKMVKYRAILGAMDQEAALIRMIDQVCPPIAAIQQSWLGGSEEVIKYEDLILRDEEILARVLLEHCRIPVNLTNFRQIIAGNRFENRTGGRRRGVEDPTSHERKGIAGDWKNHFTDRIAREFKQRFGEVLIATGYERNDRW